ncbi:helix-turn-helix domain-containing protein [Streptomyces sp. NBC_01718]|uniref:helix-turn-helix domain-containing protein n=1 Tax=Streptomyces sp. NBC_01718 TaxID=2975919 RepID=UPI00352D1871
MLEILGLGQREEAVYRHLVEKGSGAAPELALGLGITEADAAAVLSNLTGRGLAAPSADGPGHHVPAPPAVALTGLVSQRRYELEQAEATTRALAQEYRRATSRATAHDVVEVVVGAKAVRHRFEQVQASATREVLALVSADPVVVRADEHHVEETTTGRGVAYRVVIERRAMDDRTAPSLKAAIDRRQEIRVVEQVPTKLLVADGTVGLVPLLPGSTEPTALVVHAEGLLEVLVSLFEAVWAQARPIVVAYDEAAGAPGELSPDATDLQILSLMLLGLTDPMVAKQLGVGLRTVQRRMRRLMEQTGVGTRMQLGWHVSERGWINR